MSQIMKAKIGQQVRPYKAGGKVESKAIAKEEIAAFKKAGKPNLVKHEKAEHGLKGGGKTHGGKCK